MTHPALIAQEDCAEQPRRDPCNYAADRHALMQAIRDMRQSMDLQSANISGIREELARGSERFRRTEDTETELSTLRRMLDNEKDERQHADRELMKEIGAVAQASLQTSYSVNELRKSINFLSKIVLGGCGFVLLTVLGVIISQVIGQ